MHINAALTDVLVVGIGILNFECLVCPPPINSSEAMPVNAVEYRAIYIFIICSTRYQLTYIYFL
ncbi:hypothetical protein BpHYR1_001946 [Brachionus plicatilis]|uniref:Uncharacterized protein n=1 Tax=Brachionus plicatilis TaxID=10195 RepID=A0A3M7PD77_BRAPC|nr:hypothetical protein BpHYR1_001946 [Brachionus plicatilis]